MKQLLIILLLSVSILTAAAQDRRGNFIEELLRKMTVDEKIGQLNLLDGRDEITGEGRKTDIAEKIKSGTVGAIFNTRGADKLRRLQQIAVEETRLGIPLLAGLDVIHGYKTIFPIPLGCASSWDIPLIEQSARIAAQEASADGINWVFSPMVDISHDARWGRVAEGAGEDPYLASLIAAAMVRGIQGDMKNADEIMACIKHFALYGAPDGGRDYNSVDMSTQRMYNMYMAPYRAAIEAGAGSVMSSFNTINGIPATANKWLLTDVLRKDMGFKGFVVTDYAAVGGLVQHGMGTGEETAVMALKAGTEMDMASQYYTRFLKKAMEQGKIDTKDIDNACRLILYAKYDLGLFENPYKFLSAKPEDVWYTKENRLIAKKLAEESFVLLKNENEILPLVPEGRIAVVGPLADAPAMMGGCWNISSGDMRDNYKSLVQAIREFTGNRCNVTYAKGCNLYEDSLLESNACWRGVTLNRDSRTSEQLADEAMNAASDADIIIAAMGEGNEMSGESSCRTDLCLQDCQKALLERLLTLGKPIVLVYFTGRPVVMKWESEHIPAILNVWFGGSEAADAIADVLFGKTSPSGRLTMSFPRSTGQLPYYYNHLNTSHALQPGQWFKKFKSTYIDENNDMLYPFGYGLSYTTFRYGEPRLSSTEMKRGGKIDITVTITNTGKRDAYETVQLYIRDVIASVSRPVKELKGFRRIFLKAGESKDVAFTIDESMLRFYNNNLEYISEPGDFTVMIGHDSEDIKYPKTIRLI